MATNEAHITLIAALQRKDRGIGFENGLLFRNSDDLKRFKALTSGHPIVMGRKTFESFGARPLPNRANIVITRKQLIQEGVIFASSLDEALQKAREIDESIFVIGGQDIYTQALPFADRLELTLIEGNMPADTFFPDYKEFTSVISREDHIDEKTGASYEWVTLEK